LNEREELAILERVKTEMRSVRPEH
jgi:hypothetical protein